MNKSDLDQNRNNDENEEEDRRPPDPYDPKQVEEYISWYLWTRAELITRLFKINHTTTQSK